MKWGLEHIFESEDISYKYLNTKKRKKAKAKAPELEKAYNNLRKIMNEMSELDKDVFISPFNSIYVNKKASSSEIISDFESMINKTIEGAK